MINPCSKFRNDIMLEFDDVMIVPKASKVNSRSQVNLEREFTFSNGRKWKGVPIIAANMDTTGTFEIYNVLCKYKMITAMNKFYTVQDYLKFKDFLNPDYFMVSTGITDANFENLKCILSNIECNWICIDIANGYIENMQTFCIKVRNTYPDKIIVAGNVCTAEGVTLLSEYSADIVKIGIGPGSACLTRKKTGVGISQLSAILDCKKSNVKIISDGGIKSPGDVAKAFGAGADFVMIGGEFAGHDETPGDVIEIDNLKYKMFYGMSSKHAMEKHYGSMDTYRASEGAVIKVPYKGSLHDTVLDYLGGLRSACTYTDSLNLGDFQYNVVFCKRK
jgi:GMP reductase